MGAGSMASRPAWSASDFRWSAPTLADTWFTMKESELEENKMQKAEADGIPVFALKRGGKIFVMAEKCSHLGGPLSEGELDGESVVCPWHYSKFSLEDGRVLVGPATYRQPCFEVRVRQGRVEVRAPRGMVANPY